MAGPLLPLLDTRSAWFCRLPVLPEKRTVPIFLVNLCGGKHAWVYSLLCIPRGTTLVYPGTWFNFHPLTQGNTAGLPGLINILT
jgi:hypothetical protein